MDLAKPDRFKVDHKTLNDARLNHDAKAVNCLRKGGFNFGVTMYPEHKGRWLIVELIEAGCKMYDIDILRSSSDGYFVQKKRKNSTPQKREAPKPKTTRESKRHARRGDAFESSSEPPYDASAYEEDDDEYMKYVAADDDQDMQASTVTIEEITTKTTLSVIQPLANKHLNDVNNKAKHRYLRDDDYHVLHQLQRRGFSLAEYQSQNGTYEVDHLVAYFHESKMSTSFKFSKAERNALRQLLKYYETVTQEGYERGLDIYYLSCKRNVISAILKMNGELVREIKNNPYRQKGDDETSTQSSTGLSDMFKNQRLENKFKVVGACGSVLAKALTMKEAMKYIKEMGECMYCQGKMTMEPVSVFFFFSCPVVVPLIYVLFYRCNLCFRNTCK